MADAAETKKPSPMPLIIIMVVVVGLVLFFMSRRPRQQPQTALPPLPIKDPCEGIPDWACGTVALLDPLAKTSVDVFRAQKQTELQKAQLRM